jgi:hypothetical protein
MKKGLTAMASRFLIISLLKLQKKSQNVKTISIGIK